MIRAILGAVLGLVVLAPAVQAVEPGTGAVPRIAEPVVSAYELCPACPYYAYAPWLDVESFYLNLVNCTRTGGWVRSNGSCAGYGSGRYSAYVKPLVRSPGIADRVARPYAKLMAIRNACSHFLDGNPGDRLRRAGFVPSTWGENIGCRSGSNNAAVRAAVLASHLFFQAERSSNGGHWRNIKNPRFTYIGIGVWRYGTRVRLVTDFYRP